MTSEARPKPDLGPERLRLVLPVPPTANHSHVQVKQGRRLRRVPSALTKSFRTAVRLAVRQQVDAVDRSRLPILGVVAVDLVFHPAPSGRHYRRWKTDVANLEKQTTDALVLAGVLLDDRWIDDHRQRRSVRDDGPSVTVEISILRPPPAGSVAYKAARARMAQAFRPASS